MLVCEQDVEQEAIGLSQLGKIFDVVLKLPDKAKGYYTNDPFNWLQHCSQGHLTPRTGTKTAVRL